MKSPSSVPTPLRFHQPSEQAAKIIEQLAAKLKFFHWELEFPDVFTPERSGFDAMIGNPPWDMMKPNSRSSLRSSIRFIAPTISRKHFPARLTYLLLRVSQKPGTNIVLISRVCLNGHRPHPRHSMFH